MHRISRILLLLGLSALILAAACSSAGKVKSEVTVEAPTRHVLHNGVRILLQEYPFGEVVAVQLCVRAGGRDEAAAELGLAHYLEHMLFKGTTTRSKGFVDRDVEALGGYVNAGTSLDFTYYYVVLPATRAVAAIEMLADISVNSSLDETELELEKKVVIEEMRLGEDTPQRHLTRQLYGMVFDGHPYGRSLLGTPEIIQKLTRNTLLAFYRRHYVPESFTLVVVGPINKAAILQAAERTLGRLPRSGFERLPQSMPATHAEEKRGSAAWSAGLPRDGMARPEARSRRHPRRGASRLDPRSITLVASAPVAPGTARARQFRTLRLRGVRGRRRDHGDGAARIRESRPR